MKPGRGLGIDEHDEEPPSPFHWAAELGEGLFARFKNHKQEQGGSGNKNNGFSLKSLF